MRRLALVVLFACALLGCAESVRCPENEVFDDAGVCAPIRDAGPDGGPPTDGG